MSVRKSRATNRTRGPAWANSLKRSASVLPGSAGAVQVNCATWSSTALCCESISSRAGQALFQWFQSSCAPMWSSWSMGRRSQPRSSCAGRPSRYFSSAFQVRGADRARAVHRPLATAQERPSCSRASRRGSALSASCASAGGSEAIGMERARGPAGGKVKGEAQHRNRVRLRPAARSARVSVGGRAVNRRSKLHGGAPPTRHRDKT